MLTYERKQTTMSFHAYENALEIISELAPLLDRIGKTNRKLADQGYRAATSIALNVSEANERVGKDRNHLFRVALGSAAETATMIEIAKRWRFVGDRETRKVLNLLDRERAMLYRLANPRR